MLTAGVGGRGYRRPEQTPATRVLAIYPKPVYPPEIWQQGVAARVCRLRLGLNPSLAGIKHLNRLEQVLARAEWGDDGIQEGLLLDYEGFLVEGVMSNVFLVSAGRLRTPLLDRCGVAGVMRGLVIAGARESGLAVEETRIRIEEALVADEIFLTNSIIGLWPVSALEGRTFPVGEISRLLADKIDAWADAELDAS
jgi:4-amino-4-deoxychorismate lyase